MQVTVNVPERLAAEARARGVAVEVYIEEMLVRQPVGPEGETPGKSVGEIAVYENVVTGSLRDYLWIAEHHAKKLDSKTLPVK